jgi:hypothetical protein
LSSIFGRKVCGICVLAGSSNVYLQVERGLVAELKKKENYGADYVDLEDYSFLQPVTQFGKLTQSQRQNNERTEAFCDA